MRHGMFRNRVDLEIWEYNRCTHCKKYDGCPILKELKEIGVAPEVEREGLAAVCHSMEREPVA